MNITPQNLKTIYQYFSNNGLNPELGMKELIMVLGNIKYNDLYKIKTNVLSSHYRLASRDWNDIIEENRWDQLIDIDANDSQTNNFLMNLLKTDENINKLEIYQQFFPQQNLLNEVVEYARTKQIKMSQNVMKMTGKVIVTTVGSTKSLFDFIIKTEMKMDDEDTRNKFVEIFQYVDVIDSNQEKGLSLIKYMLNEKMEVQTILKIFSNLLKTHITIEPNLLKKFIHIVKSFSQEDLKSYLNASDYKRLFDIKMNKSGKSQKEGNATMYVFDIAQIAHMLKKEREIVSNNFKMLSTLLPATLEVIDDYMSASITFIVNKKFELNLIYEKDSIEMSKYIAEKLVDFCIEENRKYSEKEMEQTLIKLRDCYILDFKLDKKVHVSKPHKI